MAKIEQKVKANPSPFWSILATFSTFLKLVKNKDYMLWNHFQPLLTSFLAFLNRFQKVEKTAKIQQKVKANPSPFW